MQAWGLVQPQQDPGRSCVCAQPGCHPQRACPLLSPSAGAQQHRMPFFSDPPLSRGPHPGQSDTSTRALQTPLDPGWGWPAFLWQAPDPEATLLPVRLSVVPTPGFGVSGEAGGEEGLLSITGKF